MLPLRDSRELGFGEKCTHQVHISPNPHIRPPYILQLLLERPRSVSELVERLGISQPGTSKHLRVLREAGLVRVRVDAQRRVYALEPGPLAEVHEWLEPYRRRWDESLDALERHLEET